MKHDNTKEISMGQLWLVQSHSRKNRKVPEVCKRHIFELGRNLPYVWTIRSRFRVSSQPGGEINVCMRSVVITGDVEVWRHRSGINPYVRSVVVTMVTCVNYRLRKSRINLCLRSMISTNYKKWHEVQRGRCDTVGK